MTEHSGDYQPPTERGPEHWIPSVDVCAFCADSECDGIGCIASLDPNDERDHPRIERLHDVLRAGLAWHIMHTEGGDVVLAYAVAEQTLATAEGRHRIGLWPADPGRSDGSDE